MQEFIGLKPKIYSILSGCKQKLSAKGVIQSAQRKLKHELHRQVLLTGHLFRTSNTGIGSVNHQLQTIRTNKVSLCCFDDKRTLKKTVSRAYHWDFMKLETRLFSKTFWLMTIGKKIQRLPVPRGVNFTHWGGCQLMSKKVTSNALALPTCLITRTIRC